MKARIERWTYGGAGTGRTENGSLVALPFTLPEELVEVEGDTVTILESATARVVPRCQHFGACGGCQYQHAEYTAQARWKLGILQDTLQAAGVTGFPEARLHTGEPWGYRNRIRLRLVNDKGELQVGYNRRGGYEFLPIRECPISAPLLVRAALALPGVLESTSELKVWAARIREVEFFISPDESTLQMTLFAASERAGLLTSLCDKLKMQVPELAGAGVVIVGASGKQERPGSAWGAAGLKYGAGGQSYWVGRGSFFQVNRFLVDELVQLVTAGRTGGLAWDLYAGVGLFSRALVESFAKVVGVEIAGSELASVLKPPAGQAVTSTTLDFLARVVVERDRPDLIVADPPRAGLGLEVCALLGRIAAPEVVYVSCDPVTLARDLRAMVDSGYTVSELHLVDLFPQTFHVETVAVLKKVHNR